jgi:hypothetical protein
MQVAHDLVAEATSLSHNPFESGGYEGPYWTKFQSFALSLSNLILTWILPNKEGVSFDSDIDLDLDLDFDLDFCFCFDISTTLYYM